MRWLTESVTYRAGLAKWCARYTADREEKKRAQAEVNDPKLHVSRIGNMVQLPVCGDIIKGSEIRSIAIDGLDVCKVLVIENSGRAHECRTTSPTEAGKLRDNIAKDLALIYSPVWSS